MNLYQQRQQFLSDCQPEFRITMKGTTCTWLASDGQLWQTGAPSQVEAIDAALEIEAQIHAGNPPPCR